MKNIEQIRAKNAFEAARDSESFRGKDAGSIVKKVPTQIRENGFLGALAFALEKNKGYVTVFRAIIKHLGDVSCKFGIESSEPKDFFYELTKKDSEVLRAITTESMAYLNYLRRFVKDKKENDNV